MRFFIDAATMRAISGSIALHVCIGAWFLSHAAPLEIMPQQMIKVTMMAAPSTELMEQTSQTPLPQKAAPQKMVENVKQPVPRPAQSRAMLPQNVTQAPPSSAQASAPISPSAGSNAAAPSSAQLVTTAPLFDAAYLNNPAPEYPARAKRRGMEGSVMLGVVVRKDGAAKSVTIEESSGFSMLDASAKHAVSRWKFVPARKGNETVEARVMVPIDFRLE